MPYHPSARQPPDPAAPAKRASVMMWVLGTLAVLFGLCCAAVMAPLIGQVAAGTLNAPAADVDRLREQVGQMERQFGGVSPQQAFFAVGIGMIMIGGLLGLLAFFVRGGGRGAAVTAAVLVGLVIGWLALNLLDAIIKGGDQPGLACSLLFAGVVLGVLGVLLHWLVQAARNAPQVEAASRWANDHGGRPDPYAREREEQRRQGQLPPPDPSSPTPGSPAGPPAYAPRPPSAAYSHQPPFQPPAAPGPLFGPAPFGIPPPPGDAPAGRYGYATRPAGPPPAVPPALDSSTLAGGPGPADASTPQRKPHDDTDQR